MTKIKGYVRKILCSIGIHSWPHGYVGEWVRCRRCGLAAKLEDHYGDHSDYQ